MAPFCSRAKITFLFFHWLPWVLHSYYHRASPLGLLEAPPITRPGLSNFLKIDKSIQQIARLRINSKIITKALPLPQFVKSADRKQILFIKILFWGGHLLWFGSNSIIVLWDSEPGEGIQTDKKYDRTVTECLCNYTCRMMNAWAEVCERRQCPTSIAHFSLLYNCSDLSRTAWSEVEKRVLFSSMLTKCLLFFLFLPSNGSWCARW